MRNVRKLLLAIVLVAAACSVGQQSAQEQPSSTSAAATAPSEAPLIPAEADHPPGPQDVSTMEPGKKFKAQPNFYYFEGCGRPCWLPLYPAPQLVAGTAVNEGWPCEYYALNVVIKQGTDCSQSHSVLGDEVQIECQVRGDDTLGEGTIQNDKQERSNIFDVVIIPKDKVVRGVEQLEPTPDGSGYFALGADMWLGNTGWHGIPCQSSG
ncbi:hypothetical protein KY386_03790 [Candidatus Parcubacteria bacterium]|nr:hypothetical protein [Candidatus Parcubacteria bacterium]